MEVIVKEREKIVEVWLRQDEKELREQLKPQFTQWKKAGYLTAVFLSGSDDLTRRTSNLLCYNRKRLAEMKAQKGKSLRAVM